MKNKISKWFYVSVEDPLELWRLAREFFKKPKMQIQFYSDFPVISYQGKILKVVSKGVDYKVKNNFARIETPPYICISLFGLLGFMITWYTSYKNEFGETVRDDRTYWEYLINTYILGKPMKEVHTWYSNSQIYFRKLAKGNKPFKIIVPTVAMCLNKKGIAHLRRMLGLL